MRRLYTSTTTPALGAVVRDLSTGECLDTGVVPTISGVGCTPDFPVQDNEYGKLPTTYPLDVTIDPYDFDNRIDILDDAVYNTLYPDMWGLLDGDPDLQADVIEEACYCPGDGTRKPGLETGSPSFPAVSPLTFFWFPSQAQPANLTIREFNPDSSLPGNCCPGGEQEYIHAEIDGNEIKLTHYSLADLEERYRTNDTNITFQARAGFPKWCCAENDCFSSGDPNDPEHVKKWLHFPRYPSEDRDPYDDTNPEEPLALVPIVTDIQCDAATGILHVYHANLIVHDGIIAGLQWDTDAPRPDSESYDPAVAPTNPLDLPMNEDYQGNDIYDPEEFKGDDAAGEPLLGSTCSENCDQAFANMLRPDEACEPMCPQDGVICSADLPNGYVGEGTGVTASAATSAAIADLQATVPASCDPIEVIWICFTVYDEDLELYRSNVKGCCAE